MPTVDELKRALVAVREEWARLDSRVNELRQRERDLSTTLRVLLPWTAKPVEASDD